jgi:hypothetical protein
VAIDRVPIHVRERLVHGRVYSGRHALQRHAEPNVQQRRPVADDPDVRLRVQRRGHLLRLLRAERHALFGYDAAELRRERHLVIACKLHVRLRERRMLGRVLAGRHPLRGQRGANLRFHGPVANLAELPLRVQRGRVHGRVHAWRDPVLGQHAAELQRERAVGQRDGLWRWADVSRGSLRCFMGLRGVQRQRFVVRCSRGMPVKRWRSRFDHLGS